MANQATVAAGLTFNVESVKKDLKQFYETNFENPNLSDEEKKKVLIVPQFTGGQHAMTAFLQKLYSLILQECLKSVPKDISGVRKVSLEDLQKVILLHKGLEQYFLHNLKHFDVSQIYEHSCPVVYAEMETVRDSVSKELAFTNGAQNLVYYLLTKAFNDVAYTSHNTIEYAGHRTFTPRCVFFVVKSNFHESISTELCNAIAVSTKLSGYRLDRHKEEEQEEQGEEAEEAEGANADGDNTDAVEETKEVKKPKKDAKADAKVDTKTDAKAEQKKQKDTKPADTKPANKKNNKAPIIDVDADDASAEASSVADAPAETKEVKSQKPAPKKEQPKNNKSANKK